MGRSEVPWSITTDGHCSVFITSNLPRTARSVQVTGTSIRHSDDSRTAWNMIAPGVTIRVLRSGADDRTGSSVSVSWDDRFGRRRTYSADVQ